jgi:PAS domain S-box-containing protein
MYRSLDAAGVAGWLVDLKNGLAFSSNHLKFLFGLPEDTPDWSPATLYVDAVNADDRPEVNAQLGRSAERGDPFGVEFRVTGTDGKVRWVVSRGTTTLDESGAPAELSGAVIDITDRHLAEQALRDSERQRRLALESAETGAWNIDLESFTLSMSDFVGSSAPPTRTLGSRKRLGSFTRMIGSRSRRRWQPRAGRSIPSLTPLSIGWCIGTERFDG